MGDVVNLRRARKEKARLAAAKEKAAKRAEFGVSRAQREAAERLREHDSKRLDAHRLEAGPADDH
jgi:hypothetical protein